MPPRRVGLSLSALALTATLATAAAIFALPATLTAATPTTIGTAKKTCVPKHGADCSEVIHRWAFEHHGNLRKAKFTNAHLHGADLRGADLREADFRGAKLRHANLRSANLKGAQFQAPPKTGKRVTQSTPSCNPNCQGADLSYATLTGANLANANLNAANLTGANLDYADISTPFFSNTTCPDGTVTSTGC